MFSKVVNNFDQIVRRYTPDPFVIAIALTFLTFGLGIALTENSSQQMLEYWGNGFWNLISFTLQMTMILLGGYVVATSPPVKKALGFICYKVTTQTQAIIITTLVSSIASLINWGFGLVVGAIIALELAQRLPKLNFRLLVASAYSGFILWHGGLSGSIPLVLNTPNNFTNRWLDGTVPLEITTFSTLNISIVVTLLIVLPLLNLLYGRNSHDDFHIEFSQNQEVKAPAQTPAEKIESSKLFSIVTAIFGLGFVALTLVKGDFSLNLDSVNFIFLFLAILMHGTIKSFTHAVAEAASKVGPILIQYPFYSGIMAMLSLSGLAQMISQGFVDISNETTFPVLTFLSAGLLNIFVPSGGGQWAVQAPIVLPAVEALGADLTKSVMAVAWGDAWTNLLQPFWALPLLAIAGLKIKDIMGYCLITLAVTGVIISSFLLLF